MRMRNAAIKDSCYSLERGNSHGRRDSDVGGYSQISSGPILLILIPYATVQVPGPCKDDTILGGRIFRYACAQLAKQQKGLGFSLPPFQSVSDKIMYRIEDSNLFLAADVSLSERTLLI
jgi:hypothetical protein